MHTCLLRSFSHDKVARTEASSVTRNSWNISGGLRTLAEFGGILGSAVPQHLFRTLSGLPRECLVRQMSINLKLRNEKRNTVQKMSNLNIRLGL